MLAFAAVRKGLLDSRAVRLRLAGIGRSAGRELLGSAAVQGTTCRDWPQGWRQRRTRARWSWAMHWNHTWMQPTPYPREVESGPEWGIPPAVAAAWGMACRDWPQGQRQRRARTGGGLSEVGCSRRQSPRRVALATPDLARRVVAASGAGRMVRGLIWRRRRPGIPYIGLLKTVPQLA